MTTGSFSAPLIVHFHGALLVALASGALVKPRAGIITPTDMLLFAVLVGLAVCGFLRKIGENRDSPCSDWV